MASPNAIEDVSVLESIALPPRAVNGPSAGRDPRRTSGASSFADHGDDASQLSMATTGTYYSDGLSLTINTTEIVHPPAFPEIVELDEAVLSLAKVAPANCFSGRNKASHQACENCFEERGEQIDQLANTIEIKQDQLYRFKELTDSYVKKSQSKMKEQLVQISSFSTKEAHSKLRIGNLEEKTKDLKKECADLKKQLTAKMDRRDSLVACELEIAQMQAKQNKDMIKQQQDSAKLMESNNKLLLKEKDNQIADKDRQIKDCKTTISNLQKELDSLRKQQSTEGSQAKKTRFEMELEVANAKSILRREETKEREEKKLERKQKEEEQKSLSKTNALSSLQTFATSMGMTNQQAASNFGNNIFGMLGSGGGGLNNNGMGMGMNGGGMGMMGMNGGGMGMMGMNGGGMGMMRMGGMNGGGMGGGMEMGGMNGGGINPMGQSMQGLAATFNGPAGNPVSLAAGLNGGGGIFAGAGGGMFGGGGAGANGATGGGMFGGGGVAQMVTDGNTAPAYARAPAEPLVNNGINPVAAGFNNPGINQLQQVLQPGQQASETSNNEQQQQQA